MLQEIHEISYDRDVKALFKKHYNFSTLLRIIEILKNNQAITSKYRNHYLKGNFKGFQECHVDNNILLIYKIEANILILVRLGNHKDLLNK